VLDWHVPATQTWPVPHAGSQTLPPSSGAAPSSPDPASRRPPSPRGFTPSPLAQPLIAASVSAKAKSDAARYSKATDD
jgi:hypothetical protein